MHNIKAPYSAIIDFTTAISIVVIFINQPRARGNLAVIFTGYLKQITSLAHVINNNQTNKLTNKYRRHSPLFCDSANR